MARLTDEEKSFIKQYVDSKYYDIEKLLSYLEMHQMVGNEIFTYVYKLGSKRGKGVLFLLGY